MIDPIHVHSAQGVFAPPRRAQGVASGGQFASRLKHAIDATREVQFSAHAKQRLSDRDIQLSEADRARIARATEAASAKGSREALLLMDRLALVVGVPMRTVITVVEPNTAEDTVFTNIDSVVVVARDDA